jgi:hypothetical protein
LEALKYQRLQLFHEILLKWPNVLPPTYKLNGVKFG